MPKASTVKYEGRIPKTLRSYADKHAEQIIEVTWSDGYGDGGAYDAFLQPGWSKCDDCVHTIINTTVAGLISELRGIVPCDCEDCLDELKKREQRARLAQADAASTECSR